MRFDTDACIKREAPTVIPATHRRGVFAFEHSAAGEKAQQTAVHLGLNLGDGCGTDAPPAPSASKTASTTTQWKCTWALSRAPKRWMKATAPIQGAGLAPGLHGRKPCSTALTGHPARDHVGDGLEAAVRVIGEAADVVVGIIGAKRIEHQEWIEASLQRLGQHARELHAGTVRGRSSGDELLHTS